MAEAFFFFNPICTIASFLGPSPLLLLRFFMFKKLAKILWSHARSLGIWNSQGELCCYPCDLLFLLYLMIMITEDMNQFISRVFIIIIIFFSVMHKWENKKWNRLLVVGLFWSLNFFASRATLWMTTVFRIWKWRMDSFGKYSTLLSM